MFKQDGQLAVRRRRCSGMSATTKDQFKSSPETQRARKHERHKVRLASAMLFVTSTNALLPTYLQSTLATPPPFHYSYVDHKSLFAPDAAIFRRMDMPTATVIHPRLIGPLVCQRKEEEVAAGLITLLNNTQSRRPAGSSHQRP